MENQGGSSTATPTPTSSTRPVLAVECTDHTVYTAFTRDDAITAITQFCAPGITLLNAAQGVSNTYNYSGVTINIGISWSLSG